MDSSLLPSSPKYKNARASLLIVLAFSLVNVFAVFANYYFYFSSRIALVLVAIGAQLDIAAGTNAFKFVFAFLAIASLVPYLLSWLFSKKKVGWMIVALVLFSVDTLVLLIDVPSAIAGKDFTIIIDVVVHAIVIVELALGVKAGFDMKKEAVEAASVLLCRRVVYLLEKLEIRALLFAYRGVCNRIFRYPFRDHPTINPGIPNTLCQEFLFCPIAIPHQPSSEIR